MFLMSMFSTASHIVLIYNASHSFNSPLYAAIVVAQPFLSSFWTTSFWDKGVRARFSFYQSLLMIALQSLGQT